jgi:hypothetical protein
MSNINIFNNKRNEPFLRTFRHQKLLPMFQYGKDVDPILQYRKNVDFLTYNFLFGGKPSRFVPCSFSDSRSFLGFGLGFRVAFELGVQTIK